ncbi:MAG: AAA family ATPase, partial [Marinilabiliales bacterium]
MARKVTITCLNDNKKYKFPTGTSLNEVLDFIKPQLQYKVLGAKVNNELQELSYEVFKPKHVEFIDIAH